MRKREDYAQILEPATFFLEEWIAVRQENSDLLSRGFVYPFTFILNHR